ncbi:MAG: cytochrome c biogenesis protein CcsA [Armatimonadetes bacterium]|nr:cytochrome c biogenesis protein CcsA [Armatimonadota bacterium]
MSADPSAAKPPVAPLALLVLGLWITGAAIWSFAVPMPQGGFRDIEGYRAVFFHVPLAWAGCVAFLVAAWQAARFLLTRQPLADAAACGAAESGLVLCLLATLTGMIFAQSQWGKAWNWDPRQTSIFFVLLIYAAYLVFRQAVDDEALRGRLSASYLLLAVLPMLWLVAVFPRTAPVSLHPEKAPFDPLHWRVMFTNFAGMLGLLTVLLRYHLGIARVRAAGERW